MSDDALLDTAIEAARAMGTRRLTRTSLLRLADAYMARLAEDEQREDGGPVTAPVCGENGFWCHGTCSRHGRCMYSRPEGASR